MLVIGAEPADPEGILQRRLSVLPRYLERDVLRGQEVTTTLAHAPAGVSFQAFALFMGIAMSITAFPVLARILEERGLTRTPIGATALTFGALVAFIQYIEKFFAPIRDLSAMMSDVGAAQDFSRRCGEAMDGWVAAKEVSEERLFASLYYPMPNTDPPKFTTDWDRLSDRDIQARIRAGEAPEDVAAAWLDGIARVQEGFAEFYTATFGDDGALLSAVSDRLDGLRQR